ncbi:MAG: hypothetical protein HOE82_08490 [Gammaproteobacteria bacterium]|jgi:hypothetical protein|nr:hypothetical protein [Gammaproteobacteria bacterium]
MAGRLGEAKAVSDWEWMAQKYLDIPDYLMDRAQLGVAEGITSPAIIADIPHMVRNQTLEMPLFEASSQGLGRMIGWDDRPRPNDLSDRADIRLRNIGMVTQLGAGIPGPISYAQGVIGTGKKVGDTVGKVVNSTHNPSRREFLGSAGKAAAAATVPIATMRALGEVAPVVSKADDVVRVASKNGNRWDGLVDTTYDADLAHGARPSETAFLRERSGNPKYYTKVDNFNGDYDIASYLGKEKVTRYDELTHIRDQGKMSTAQKAEFEKLNADLDVAFSKARQGDFPRMTPENQAKYEKLNNQYSSMELYTHELHPSFDGQGWSPSLEEARDANANGLRNLKEEMKNLMRNDPNINAYRRERARAFATAQGDEMWQARQAQLRGTLDKGEAMKANILEEWRQRPLHSGNAEEAREAGMELNKIEQGIKAIREEYSIHSELGKRVGLVK